MTAKSSRLLDFPSSPTDAKWIWKDDTNSMEKVILNPNAEKNDRRNKEKKTRAQFQDTHKKGGERGATPSGRTYGMGFGRQSRLAGHRASPAARTNKQGEDHTHITLADVKQVALERLSDGSKVCPMFEDILFSTEQFDEFLLFLLNYFHWFFLTRALENKPNPMNIEPSRAERQQYEDMCVKHQGALKLLGQRYSVLVLGIGMQDGHHMACGQSRVSSTGQDRAIYETLYSFCTFLVWISFRRKEHFDVVRKEIGRMLRSDTFNPSIRVKNAVDKVESTDTAVAEETAADKNKPRTPGMKSVHFLQQRSLEKKLTPAEYRRVHGKRPPIKTIVNQRSPALVSILPSPKEEAHWLFKKATDLENAGKQQDVDPEEEFADMISSTSNMKVGIIGEPVDQFNPITLAPKRDDNEEEGEEDEQKHRESTMVSTPHTGKSPQSREQAGTDLGMSRQATAISQATTEALSDDD